MRLRKPCEHGQYDRHHIDGPGQVGDVCRCPGGEFLADDALAVALHDADAADKTDPEQSNIRWDHRPPSVKEHYHRRAMAILDALTVREGAG